MAGRFRFDRFLLDTDNRQLSRDGAPLELNARYFDALALLVREQGRLVSKDRFLQEVWRGVPVTDEALTQCIKTLRRLLGDDAGRPRFIETAPKHGYRFIAPVVPAGEPGPTLVTTPDRDWRPRLLLGVAGAAGGAAAGMIGGLFYSVAGGATAWTPEIGAASILLVLVCLTMLIGAVGGAAVALGIAAGGFGAGTQAWRSVGGGALGGLIVGAFANMLGLDVFNLLLGRSPGAITGGPEGALLGAAVGLGAWIAARSASPSLGRRLVPAALLGAAAGVLIHLAGGRLMAGSLQALATRFPESRLRMDEMGQLFGEQHFGLLSQTITGGIEGLLFTACVVAAMILAREHLVAGDALVMRGSARSAS